MTLDLYIFDSDGVLVEEGIAIDGASKTTSELREAGKKVVIFSNNSTKHPKTMEETYFEQNIFFDEVINSGQLMVNFLKQERIKSVYVVGENGFKSLLRENGLIIKETDVDAVVVGMDRTLTYEKLAIACRNIRRGARFVASNSDASFPTPRGLEPGAGSMIAAIETASEVPPEIILGKPNSYGYEYILNKYNIPAENAIMIGDRFETDILGALKVGMQTVVVNTGVAKTRENPGKYEGHEVRIINNLTEILNFR
ncbi:MAG: HAD-IIA family hydrolase [Candidatus Heimdallarchaeota archaeon]|nr:HAD-IIA family hydrolase [Candidatus Heimdallarchaeota archaeon]